MMQGVIINYIPKNQEKFEILIPIKTNTAAAAANFGAKSIYLTFMSTTN